MISKANIQLVKGLQDKKLRQKYGQFIVEGEKSIAELLKSPYKVIKLFAVSEWLKNNQLDLKSLQIFEVTDQELKQLSSHNAPQKVLAIVQIPDWSNHVTNGQWVLALDAIQDPGNLGTIIRIADWYGIDTIICGVGCTDVYAPKCINSTMGSFLRVKVLYCDIIEFAKKHQYPLAVADFNGINIHKGPLPNKGVLVIGNEGHGVNQSILDEANYELTIPKFGQAESLNAAVSTAILIDRLMA
jgi:TrmH family RNA methyltransferase